MPHSTPPTKARGSRRSRAEMFVSAAKGREGGEGGVRRGRRVEGEGGGQRPGASRRQQLRIAHASREERDRDGAAWRAENVRPVASAGARDGVGSARVMWRAASSCAVPSRAQDWRRGAGCSRERARRVWSAGVTGRAASPRRDRGCAGGGQGAPARDRVRVDVRVDRRPARPQRMPICGIVPEGTTAPPRGAQSAAALEGEVSSSP